MTPDLSAFEGILSFQDDRPDLLYRPGPTVSRFLASVARLALLIAANQIGKTSALCKWANDQCLGYTGQGPGVLLVMIADLDNQFPVFCSKLREVIAYSELHPACKYVEGKGFYTHGRRLVKYNNGAQMEFRGGRGEQMAAASITCDLGAVVDEIPIRGHFSEALRAAQRWLAPVRVGFTAIGRPADWFRRRVAGMDGKPAEDCDPKTGEPLWAVFNCGLSLEECPWMTQEQVDLIYAQTDPAERDQRLHGAWEGPTPGRRFTGMSAECIVSEVPAASYVVTVTMDHGEGVGRQFALEVFEDPDTGKVYIVDEYVNEEPTTTEADADGIAAMLSRSGVGLASVDHWWGDVNSAGKQGAGRSVNELMARSLSLAMGVPRHRVDAGAVSVRIRKPAKPPGSVELGERLLNLALLRGDLMVHERCKRFIRCLWSYRGGNTDENKHGIDAARYGVIPILSRRPTYQRLFVRR